MPDAIEQREEQFQPRPTPNLCSTCSTLRERHLLCSLFVSSTIRCLRHLGGWRRPARLGLFICPRPSSGTVCCRHRGRDINTRHGDLSIVVSGGSIAHGLPGPAGFCYAWDCLPPDARARVVIAYYLGSEYVAPWTSGKTFAFAHLPYYITQPSHHTTPLRQSSPPRPSSSSSRPHGCTEPHYRWYRINSNSLSPSNLTKPSPPSAPKKKTKWRPHSAAADSSPPQGQALPHPLPLHHRKQGRQ